VARDGMLRETGPATNGMNSRVPVVRDL